MDDATLPVPVPVVLDEVGRPEPPETADEAATLLGFLDFQRATLAWKTAGLDATGLATPLPPSTMTLGGLLKHLAYVESHWFGRCLHALDAQSPWDAVDWADDPDWEWHTAADDDPADLRALWQAEVERSRELTARALAAGDLGQLARRTRPDGTAPNLRWILVHMIEEYARHNGHADLLREHVDGEVGE
ncbi:DinB family protein [Cellulomonas soli]